MSHVVVVPGQPRRAREEAKSRSDVGEDADFVGRACVSVERQQPAVSRGAIDADARRIAAADQTAVTPVLERDVPSLERLVERGQSLSQHRRTTSPMWRGTSVMMPSTPIAARARASAASLTVHTFTIWPRLCHARKRAPSISVRSGCMAPTWITRAAHPERVGL